MLAYVHTILIYLHIVPFAFSEVVTRKGIEPLIEMLSDSCELASANAACVLTNMATDEGMRSEVQRLGVVPALIEPLKSR